MNRTEKITRIRNSADVTILIVGAGINGIGVFRDLALQGVNVLLVDRGDYCSGTSAASSHMVHGGIRYLENGEFRLVREAVEERNRLLLNAPHLVQIQPTIFPLFKWFSGLWNAPLKFIGLLDKPAERGVIMIKIGMWLYDQFSRTQGSVKPHKFINQKTAFIQFPNLNRNLLYAGKYYDAVMPSPERICIELISDGEVEGDHAMAINYMRVEGMRADGIVLVDETNGEEIRIKPKIVVNAAGPWIDITNESFGKKTEYIWGTKGSHLVLDNAELRQEIGENEFFFENEDGRIVLILPLADKVLVGTSDIRVESAENIRCTDEEVQYFFRMIKLIFPSIEITEDQIVFRFAGVRPLPPSPAGQTGQISRDHSIKIIEPEGKVTFPVLSLVGGKWTTYRAFAEQVTDNILDRINQPRMASTRTTPIGGGENFPVGKEARYIWVESVAKESQLTFQQSEILLMRYGTRGRDIARYLLKGEDWPLGTVPQYSRREILYLAKNEAVVHLEDMILRRTMIGILGQTTIDVLDEIAEIIGNSLGWDQNQRKEEVQRTRDILADKHGVKL